uniref:Uncharacterized protein n=1 Tax=Desertifilum tharense IPPAS B-1220 TaxID=1781255 RepID=A0ACD5H329_9CYAN
MHVQRQGDRLVIQEGTSVAQLPSKRRKKPPFKRGGKGGGGKPRSQRPTRPGDRSASASTPAPQRRDAPLPKPLKRKNRLKNKAKTSQKLEVGVLRSILAPPAIASSLLRRSRKSGWSIAKRSILKQYVTKLQQIPLCPFWQRSRC